ncbi:MAG: tetratricopeptide repeat protein [Flavobacteriales bacterium]|nr:tetratricopeptide repeat protein [Flavobacteriales bacterium]
MRWIGILLFVIAHAAFAQTEDKRLGHARQLLAKGKAYKAKSHAERYRAVQTDPAIRAQMSPYYADALNRIAEYEKAEAVCRQDIGASPSSDAQLLLQWAIAFNGLGVFDSALVKLERARASGVEVSPVYQFASGTALQGLKQWEAAVAAYDEVLKGEETNVRAWRERAFCHAMVGDTAKARMDYDQALALAPKDPVTLNSRGYFKAYVLNDHRAAITDYDRAIKMDPNYSFAFNNRGWSWFKLGDPEKALRDIDLARRKKARNPFIYRNLGLIRLEQGDTASACGQFRTALEMDFARFGGDEVEQLMKAHCAGRTTPPPSPVIPPVGNAPRNTPPPRTNAP